jgi:hypothetical protein
VNQRFKPAICAIARLLIVEATKICLLKPLLVVDKDDAPAPRGASES